MKTLLEAGVHFGHQTRRWNPKMRKFIFTERNGIHIIDLAQTVDCLEAAAEFVRDLVANGGTLLFVGTKRQAQETIDAEAKRCGMPFVITRWLGGTLTNFHTIQGRIDYLVRLEDAKARGEMEHLPKKERLKTEEKIARLNRYLGGIKEMTAIPSAVYIVDTTKEELAVKESLRVDVPIISLVDTNCDPDVIDYPIPSNDDAIRAIKLITKRIADAVLDGLTAREYAQQAALEAEEVEVDAYKETGYSVSPDEPSPQEIQAKEEAAAAEVAAAEAAAAAKVAAAEATAAAKSEAATETAADAEGGAATETEAAADGEAETPAKEAEATAGEASEPESAAESPAETEASTEDTAEPPATPETAEEAPEPQAETAEVEPDTGADAKAESAPEEPASNGAAAEPTTEDAKSD
ncbi:MAG: 30S ribosomal protein S2 [Chloroflexi bacterium]|nr:30S ribosomal protein S2 [Chloroflexota bacterium]